MKKIRNKKIDGLWVTEEYLFSLLDKIKELQDRINKAIEYIESYNLPKDLGKLSEAPISVNELKELLKILKEKNNG